MTEKIYKNGYIYKLHSHINDCFYIGSCHMPMKSRMFIHKHSPVNKKVEAWIEDIGSDELKYEVIATYKDITKQGLKKHEDAEVRKYLRIDDNCLNCQRVYLTVEERKERIKQYYQDNKKKIAEQKKQWCQDNKDKVKQYYQDNKERMKETNKQYRENNKELIR